MKYQFLLGRYNQKVVREMDQTKETQYGSMMGWTFVYLLGLFWLHRGLSFPFLLEGQSLEGIWVVQAWLVGCASDIWVSACLTLLHMLLIAGFSVCFPKNVRHLHCMLWGMMALVVACHQGYIEFFHAPILPFHLSYIKDWDFIRSNGSSLFAWRSAILAGFGLMALLLWQHWQKSRGKSNHRWVVVAGLLGGIGLHVWHIRYKVQWFVPESLQYNVIENLYVRWIHAVSPQPLTSEEMAILAEKMEVKLDPTESEIASLERILLHPISSVGALSLTGKHLVTEVQQLQAKGDSPLVLVMLLESFRAIDVGRSVHSIQSMTPQFDALSQKGIWFPDAWSTGTVTRGGQEAAWCGYWGGLYTSGMREVAVGKNFPPTCIPDLAKDAIWLHGGEGHFDNQVAYWKRHGVLRMMDLHHFPPETPRTGWGISDRAFFLETVSQLREGREAGETRAGFLLSVSNHIPWEVPTDAPDRMKQVVFSGQHPSEKTVWYVDDAIGEWVEKMKAAHLWDSSLVVLVGDHGILAPSFYGAPLESRFQQLGHVGFLLSGGIAERVAAQSDVEKVQSEIVSQMDIAPFISLLLGKSEEKFMGDSLFQQKRRSVVMSHLMDEVYFPQYSVALPFRACEEASKVGQATFPRAYCRAMLRYVHKMRVTGQ